MPSIAKLSPSRAALGAAVLLVAACSGSSHGADDNGVGGGSSGGAAATAGAASAGAAGSSAGTGGSPGSASGGLSSSTGGSPIGGTSTASGGLMQGAGGVPQSTGGRRGRGGSPSGTGGSAGAAATGGATASGGTSATGGAAATGGAGGACTPNTACMPTAPSTGDIYADCVARVNQFRACVCLPPLQRWTDGEACANQDAMYDDENQSMGAHAGFKNKICTAGNAQDECPGWRTNDQVVSGCLQQMFNEGPPPTATCSGDCYEMHGHYINMTNTRYTMIACGYYTGSDGKVWAVQNFK